MLCGVHISLDSICQDVNSFDMFQIVLIGDHGAGKTTLCHSIVNDSRGTTATIGASKFDLDVPDFPHKLVLWDTAGFEQYNALSSVYYRNSSLAILVFDRSVAASLSSARQWVATYRDDPDRASNPVFLVANKTDLPQAVSSDAIIAVARANNCQVMEVCARDGTNVPALVTAIVDTLRRMSPVEVTVPPQYQQRVKNVECC